MKKKIKILTTEEQVVWKKFSEDIIKTQPHNTRVIDKQEAKKIKNSVLTSFSHSSSDVINNRTDLSVNSLENRQLLDKKIHNKLKTGKLRPSRFLDLHGLRYERAQYKVIEFITSAYNQDYRLVLIITGKGKKIYSSKPMLENERSGVLKQALPLWLEDDKIKPLILNVSNAHGSHGGDGAFYVYLRKKKHQRT